MESMTRRSQVQALIKLQEIKEDQRHIDREAGKMQKQPEEDEHTVVSNHMSQAQTKTWAKAACRTPRSWTSKMNSRWNSKTKTSSSRAKEPYLHRTQHFILSQWKKTNNMTVHVWSSIISWLHSSQRNSWASLKTWTSKKKMKMSKYRKLDKMNKLRITSSSASLLRIQTKTLRWML